MVTEQFRHNIDLRKNLLYNTRIHNVTNAERITLGGELTANHKGIVVYDTEDEALHTWNGTAWDMPEMVTTTFNGRSGPTITSESGDYNTDMVTEGTNKYFTTARARASISAGTGLDYNVSTGIMTLDYTPDPPPDGSETIVTEGTNISVSGSGTIASPYVISNTAPLITNNNQLTNGAGYLVATTAATLYAPINGSTAYIQNSVFAQASANFNINGNGKAYYFEAGGTSSTISAATNAVRVGYSSALAATFIYSGGSIYMVASGGTVIIGDTTAPSGTELIKLARNTVINGTVRVVTRSNATGDVATYSSTGILQKRTATEIVSDGGGQTALSGTGIVKSTAGAISYINGSSTQYVAGDGTLVTFPTSNSSFSNGANYVTSISLITPSVIYTTPVTFSVTSGAATATLSLNTQTANTVFAGPTTGIAATPTFRALVAADIPSLSATYVPYTGATGPVTLGQALSVTSLTATGLTSGRIVYTTTGGLQTTSANLTFSGSAVGITGTLDVSSTATLSSQVLVNGASTFSAGIRSYGVRRLRVEDTGGSASFGATGTGIESFVSAGTGFIQVADAAGTQTGILAFRATTINIQPAASTVASFSSTGVVITGLSSATANIIAANTTQGGARLISKRGANAGALVTYNLAFDASTNAATQDSASFPSWMESMYYGTADEYAIHRSAAGSTSLSKLFSVKSDGAIIGTNYVDSLSYRIGATTGLGSTALDLSGGYLRINSGSPGATGTKVVGRLNITSLTSYADNTAALAGGLSVGDLYRNGSIVQAVI